jgi:Tetracyclin repressor-like, C-terminal domain
MRNYIAWALEYPARFKLVFGAWSIDSEESHIAAQTAQTTLVDLVAATQDAGALPAGDPVRLASLVRALALGAADLAAGHLASEGKRHASPEELVDDLSTTCDARQTPRSDSLHRRRDQPLSAQLGGADIRNLRPHGITVVPSSPS